MSRKSSPKPPPTHAPPLTVENPSHVRWDEPADVLVVGFGGAGVSAALQAREEGASVLVLERFQGGGATTISGGVYYAGGGTHIQKEAGVEDDPENMFEYLRQEVGEVGQMCRWPCWIVELVLTSIYSIQ